MNRKLFITIAVILLVIILIIIMLPFPLPVSFSNKQAFHDPVQVYYNGEGMLYVCAADGDIPVSGENTTILKAPVEAVSGRERTVLVYTPPGFRQSTVYPVLYLLHGFAARPAFWVENLIPAIEEAVISGELQPLVVVMPDGTLSGNGTDDPGTGMDERGGCWYINSNRTKYEDFMLADLPAFVQTIARISDDPKNTVIAGSSMGGYGAAYYTLKYPELFRNAAMFYPALDLRYAIGRNRLKPYRAEKYKAVAGDKPLRIVNKAAGAGFLGLTEKWCYYPVFDSDFCPGEVWKEDLPVWRRMKEVNPDLAGSRFFILTGSKDDFNFDDHQKVVLPMIRQAGGIVEPDETVISGGRHNWDTVGPFVPDFISWLGNTFR